MLDIYTRVRYTISYNVPEASEICLQGWAAFYFTLTTSDAG